MIVIVESNFVLELALRQSDAADALHIVSLAEHGRIKLALPAYALVEPLHKLKRTQLDRASLLVQLQDELGQMSRSANFADLEERSRAMMLALAEKSRVDKSEFSNVQERLLKCAEVIPLTSEIIKAAIFRELIDLEPPDALIYESIESFLELNPGAGRLFLNKNARDFLGQFVVSDLAELGCEVMTNIAHARARIDAHLRKVEGGTAK